MGEPEHQLVIRFDFRPGGADPVDALDHLDAVVLADRCLVGHHRWRHLMENQRLLRQLMLGDQVVQVVGDLVDLLA